MARPKKKYNPATHIKSPKTGRHVRKYGSTWWGLKQEGELRGEKYRLLNPGKAEEEPGMIVKQSNVFEDVKGLSQEDLKKLFEIIKKSISEE